MSKWSEAMVDRSECVIDLLCRADGHETAIRVRHLPSGLSVNRSVGSDGMDAHLEIAYSLLEKMVSASSQGLEPKLVPDPSGRAAELWPNNPSHDWIVQRTHRLVISVVVTISLPRPSVPELKGLRRHVPQFQSESPTALRQRLEGTSNIVLSDVTHREAEQLVNGLLADGVKATVDQSVETSHLPIDRTTGCAWLIEVHDVANKVAEMMIQDGVPVVVVEQD